MRRYWVVYEYGQGGVWAVVAARSAEEIRAHFPELGLVADRPGWMSDDLAARLEANVLDLDRPTGLLADLLAERARST